MNEFDFIPDDMLDELVTNAVNKNAIVMISGYPYINWNVAEELLNRCIDIDNELGGDGTRGVAIALLSLKRISEGVIAREAVEAVEEALRGNHATEEEGE